MIKLEGSDEAVKGLAKLICENPTLPSKLRRIQSDLLNAKSMRGNKKYIREQEAILKKAEEIGLATTGYVFEINFEKEYMIYRKIVDEMVPLKPGFKSNPRNTIKSFDNLLHYIKENNLTNLVTFDPSFQEYFCSHPWDNFEEVDSGEEEIEDWGHAASHEEIRFNNGEIDKLKNNRINFYRMNKKDSYDFNLKLKNLNL